MRSQSTLASSNSTSTVLMTLEEFDMEVVDIASEEELDEFMANDDVVFCEPGEFSFFIL